MEITSPWLVEKLISAVVLVLTKNPCPGHIHRFGVDPPLEAATPPEEFQVLSQELQKQFMEEKKAFEEEMEKKIESLRN